MRETLHSINAKKQASMLLKLDIQKAYDRVNWNFLEKSVENIWVW